MRLTKQKSFNKRKSIKKTIFIIITFIIIIIILLLFNPPLTHSLTTNKYHWLEFLDGFLKTIYFSGFERKQYEWVFTEREGGRMDG